MSTPVWTKQLRLRPSGKTLEDLQDCQDRFGAEESKSKIHTKKLDSLVGKSSDLRERTELLKKELQQSVPRAKSAIERVIE